MARTSRVSNDTTKVLGWRLNTLVREASVKTGKTQTQIANEIGVKSSCLSEWTADKATPLADAIPRIAKYFGVSSDWLLGLTDIKETKLSNSTSRLKKPWRVDIEERHARTVIIWAEDEEEANDIASDLLSDGVIELGVDYYAGKDIRVDGGAIKSDFGIFDQYPTREE